MSEPKPKREIKHADWVAEARRRFGTDPMDWAFVCPVCGHVATLRQWKMAGAPEGQWAYSCIGRALGSPNGFLRRGAPCDYAGGGLFRLNPVMVIRDDGSVRETFEFADR